MTRFHISLLVNWRTFELNSFHLKPSIIQPVQKRRKLVDFMLQAMGCSLPLKPSERILVYRSCTHSAAHNLQGPMSDEHTRCLPQRTPRSGRRLHWLHVAAHRVSHRCKREHSIASPSIDILFKRTSTHPPLTRVGQRIFIHKSYIRCWSWGPYSLVDSLHPLYRVIF